MNRFIGIPWKRLGEDYDGCDCWGLVALILRDHFGVDVPSHKELRKIALDTGELEPSVFSVDCTPVDDRKPGDILHMWGLVERRKLPVHVGLVVEGHSVIHVEREGQTSHIIRTDRKPHDWRVIQCYRLRQLM